MPVFLKADMASFLEWFGVGVLVSTVCFAIWFAINVARVEEASPGIGAVSFTLQTALAWILGGAIVVATIATAIKAYLR